MNFHTNDLTFKQKLGVALGCLLVFAGVAALWYGIYWVLSCFIDSNMAAVIAIVLFLLTAAIRASRCGD